MKIFIRFIFISLMFLSNLSAQTTPDVKVKAAVDELFKVCKAEDLKSAAKLIAYTGQDEKRHLKGIFNIKDKKESSKINRIMKKVSAFLKISDKYEFGKYSSSAEDQIQLHAIEVLFMSGEQELTTTFLFIELNNKFLLADIN